MSEPFPMIHWTAYSQASTHIQAELLYLHSLCYVKVAVMFQAFNLDSREHVIPHLCDI